MMQGGMSPYMLVAQNQMAQQQYQLQLQQQMLAQAGYQEVRSSLGKNPFDPKLQDDRLFHFDSTLQ